MSYADPERKRARDAAYYRAHRKEYRAQQRAYKASPQGREAAARSLYNEWRKRIAQRLISKPLKLAALEAELAALLGHP
jgi:hypothetical protein